MRPERGLTFVVWILWALIIFGMWFLFLGCVPQEKREPIVLEGGVQCVPRANQIFCMVRLEEQVDE